MGITKLLMRFIILTFTAASVKAEQQLFARIVHGKDAEIKDYTYHVALELYKLYHCGGAIYSQKVIITAAHCLHGFRVHYMKLRAGSSFPKNGGVLYEISRFIIHPKYDSKTFLNDIGLLILKKTLKLGPTVRKIQLGTTSPCSDDKAVVTGFGQSLPDKAVYKDQLQYTEVKIISKRKCASKMYDYGGWILKGMICAGGNSTTCMGDSGGPMVVGGKLAGITSWGPTICGSPRRPAVYTDVAKFVSWIRKMARNAI